jgi:uncharacterized repeat protein (TIGR03803 family)
VFKVRTDGTGFVTLHSFTGSADGAYPRAALALSGNMLFGTTEDGGTAGKGVLFKIDTNGTGFAILHTFTNGSDGSNPYGGLLVSGNILFGTAYFGGSNGFGTVFKLDVDGNNFTTLHHFTYYDSDGANPASALVLSGNMLYGTAHGGGDWGYGTVFKLNTNGTGFVTILSCRYFDVGAYPFAGLVLSGNTVYGATSSGGGLGYGTVFKVNTDSSGYVGLHAFMGGIEGSTPQGLVLSGTTLYGTTLWGGDGSPGTVFQVDTEGANFATVHSFAAGDYNTQGYSTNSDGANPNAGLTLSGNTLYGTASAGGLNSWGTVFELRLSPAPIPLGIQLINRAVVLSWTDSSFSLQAAPAATGVYTNIPGATSPYTNAVTGQQRFFRLEGN